MEVEEHFGTATICEVFK